MSLTLPYDSRPVAKPTPPTLPSGQSIRWRSFVSLHIEGDSGGATIDDVLIDTGAVDITLRADLAPLIGVTFIPHPKRAKWQFIWAGKKHKIDYGKITLELEDASGAKLHWDAVVGFVKAPIPYSGFPGQSGFLEFLNATFDGPNKNLILDPTPAFPGMFIPQ